MTGEQDISRKLTSLNLSAMTQEIEKYLEDFSYKASPDERFRANMLRNIGEYLGAAMWLVNKLNSPVVSEGKLIKRKDGRYEIQDTDHYFTSGSEIELLIQRYPDDPESWEWVSTRIEYHDDYYAIGYLGLKLDGVMARIR